MDVCGTEIIEIYKYISLFRGLLCLGNGKLDPYSSLLTFHKTDTEPGSIFTNRTDVLPQDLVKNRSREIHV